MCVCVCVCVCVCPCTIHKNTIWAYGSLLGEAPASCQYIPPMEQSRASKFDNGVNIYMQSLYVFWLIGIHPEFPNLGRECYLRSC